MPARSLAVAAGAATAVGLVGCGALTGAPRVVPEGVATTAPATTSGAATAPSGGAVAGGPGAAGSGILGKVVPVPDGARAWTHNKTGVLSLADFVGNFYKASVQTEEMATVQRRGFVTAARHGWFTRPSMAPDSSTRPSTRSAT